MLFCKIKVADCIKNELVTSFFQTNSRLLKTAFHQEMRQAKQAGSETEIYFETILFLFHSSFFAFSANDCTK